MGRQAGSRENAGKNNFLTAATTAIIAFALLVLPAAPLSAHSAAGQAPSPQSPAPPPTPQWQVDAGGKMAFDVASVKQDAAAPSPTTVSANMPLGDGDYYSPTGGLFSATNFILFTYISLAYKLSGSQDQVLQQQVPKWVLSDRFDIEARVEGKNPTKDQMRLMMQDLLADRFKLRMHRETRVLPVFALVLDKAGQTGPGLQPHSDETPCPTDPGPIPALRSAPPATVAACGGIQLLPGSVPGRLALGARRVTMEMIASTLPSLGGVGGVDRPVIDKTGLSETFDLHFEFAPQFNGPPPPNFVPDADGPTFLEALKEQLGLKLESQTGPVDVMVVDHVEQPSEN